MINILFNKAIVYVNREIEQGENVGIKDLKDTARYTVINHCNENEKVRNLLIEELECKLIKWFKA